MVTPAECEVFQTVFEVCLNGYCFQPAEVNDVLPSFQDKDQNYDCRVDERDFGGSSLKLAEAFVSAKKWDDFSAEQFNDWAKLIGGMKDISADLRKLDNLKPAEYQYRGGMVGGDFVSLYDDNAWYNEIIPITGSQGQNFQARADEVCDRLSKFLSSSDGNSLYSLYLAIHALPSVLQTSTRQSLAIYHNDQEGGMSFIRKDSSILLSYFSEDIIFINPVCD